MAKQKGLTLEDLLKSREAMKKEDISEGATGMRSIAAAVSPSLTPLAQSLGKLQQISDPKVVEGVAPVKSVDTSLSKEIKEVSNSLKTMVQLNRNLNKSIDKVNENLVKQLAFTKLVEKRQSKQDEENSEFYKRLLGGKVSTDIESSKREAVKQIQTQAVASSTSQQGSGSGFNVSLPRSVPVPTPTGAGTKPGSNVGRAGALATVGSLARGVGGALVKGGIGGLLGAAAYGIMPQLARDKLMEYSIDEESLVKLGAIIGVAMQGPVSALTAIGTTLGELTRNIIKGPAGEGYRDIIKQPKGAELLGALDPELAFGTAIMEAPTVSELVKIAEAADRRNEGLRRLDEREAVENLEYQARSGRATPTTPVTQGIFPTVSRETVDQQAAANVTVITENTPDIPEDRAREILGGGPFTGASSAETWKSMSRAQRQLKLREAVRNGVDLTMRPSVPQLNLETMPVLSGRLGGFNSFSTEQATSSSTAQQAPMIIRGGDTINNVSNVGGSGGGSSGSPSLLYNPWEEQQIGRRWAPYPSGWR